VLNRSSRRTVAVFWFPLAIAVFSAATSDDACPRTKLFDGTCASAVATPRDDSVDVRASTPGIPGSEKNSGAPNADTGRAGNAGAGGNDAGENSEQLWEWDPDAYVPLGLLPDGTEYTGEPIAIPRGGWVPIEPTIFSVDEIVTVDDLVNLRPAAAGLRMEPNGWTVIGLDTNFWIDVTTNTQSGELLGRSASVRFTPIGYRYNYGNSGTVNRTSAGGSWTAQNLAEFDPTPTSHIYTQPGSYTVTAAVEYSAQYQFDGATWMPVLGTVRTPTNTLDVIAARATTVLVNNNCLTTPAGPGC
jgi:hypothetical protein